MSAALADGSTSGSVSGGDTSPVHQTESPAQPADVRPASWSGLEPGEPAMLQVAEAWHNFVVISLPRYGDCDAEGSIVPERYRVRATSKQGNSGNVQGCVERAEAKKACGLVQIACLEPSTWYTVEVRTDFGITPCGVLDVRTADTPVLSQGEVHPHAVEARWRVDGPLCVVGDGPAQPVRLAMERERAWLELDVVLKSTQVLSLPVTRQFVEIEPRRTQGVVSVPGLDCNTAYFVRARVGVRAAHLREDSSETGAPVVIGPKTASVVASEAAPDKAVRTKRAYGCTPGETHLLYDDEDDYEHEEDDARAAGWDVEWGEWCALERVVTLPYVSFSVLGVGQDFLKMTWRRLPPVGEQRAAGVGQGGTDVRAGDTESASGSHSPASEEEAVDATTQRTRVSDNQFSHNDACVVETKVQIWEDPTQRIRANAGRRARGRHPKQRELLRATYVYGRDDVRRSASSGTADPAEDAAECAYRKRSETITGLSPDSTYFVTVTHRNPTGDWYSVSRHRFATLRAPEILSLDVSQSSVVLTATPAVRQTLSFCNLNVSYPLPTVFSDDSHGGMLAVPPLLLPAESQQVGEGLGRYTGSGVAILPNGQRWCRPSVPDRPEKYGVKCVDVDGRGCVIRSFDSAEADKEDEGLLRLSVMGLQAGVAYLISLRTLAGGTWGAWGSPLLASTVHPLLLSVASRTDTEMTIRWGRNPITKALCIPTHPPLVVATRHDVPPHTHAISHAQYQSRLTNPAPGAYYYDEWTPLESFRKSDEMMDLADDESQPRQHTSRQRYSAATRLSRRFQHAARERAKQKKAGTDKSQTCRVFTDLMSAEYPSHDAAASDSDSDVYEAVEVRFTDAAAKERRVLKLAGQDAAPKKTHVHSVQHRIVRVTQRAATPFQRSKKAEDVAITMWKEGGMIPKDDDNDGIVADIDDDDDVTGADDITDPFAPILKAERCKQTVVLNSSTESYTFRGLIENTLYSFRLSVQREDAHKKQWAFCHSVCGTTLMQGWKVGTVFPITRQNQMIGCAPSSPTALTSWYDETDLEGPRCGRPVHVSHCGRIWLSVEDVTECCASLSWSIPVATLKASHADDDGASEDSLPSGNAADANTERGGTGRPSMSQFLADTDALHLVPAGFSGSADTTHEDYVHPPGLQDGDDSSEQSVSESTVSDSASEASVAEPIIRMPVTSESREWKDAVDWEDTAELPESVKLARRVERRDARLQAKRDRQLRTRADKLRNAADPDSQEVVDTKFAESTLEEYRIRLFEVADTTYAALHSDESEDSPPDASTLTAAVDTFLDSCEKKETDSAVGGITVVKERVIYFRAALSRVHVTGLVPEKAYIAVLYRHDGQQDAWGRSSTAALFKALPPAGLCISDMHKDHIAFTWDRPKADSALTPCASVSSRNVATPPGSNASPVDTALCMPRAQAAPSRVGVRCFNVVLSMHSGQGDALHPATLERKVVGLSASSHHLYTLRPSTVYTASVLPLYEGGLWGRLSDPIRFFYSYLTPTVEAVTESHVHVSWDLPVVSLLVDPDTGVSFIGKCILQVSGLSVDLCVELPGTATSHHIAQLEAETEYTITLVFAHRVHSGVTDDALPCPTQADSEARDYTPRSLVVKTSPVPVPLLGSLGEDFTVVSLPILFHPVREPAARTVTPDAEGVSDPETPPAQPQNTRPKTLRPRRKGLPLQEVLQVVYMAESATGTSAENEQSMCAHAPPVHVRESPSGCLGGRVVVGGRSVDTLLVKVRVSQAHTRTTRIDTIRVPLILAEPGSTASEHRAHNVLMHIGGLRPNTAYNVEYRQEVACRTMGTWSEELHISTLPPLIPSVTSVGEQFVLLTWEREPGLEEYIKHMPQLFQVAVEETSLQPGGETDMGLVAAGASKPDTRTVFKTCIQTSLHSAVIVGLTPRTPYKARARQKTSTRDEEWGVWSGDVYFNTLPEILPKVVSKGQDYLHVAWEREPKHHRPTHPIIAACHNAEWQEQMSPLVGAAVRVEEYETGELVECTNVDCSEADAESRSLVTSVKLKPNTLYNVSVRTVYNPRLIQRHDSFHSNAAQVASDDEEERSYGGWSRKTCIPTLPQIALTVSEMRETCMVLSWVRPKTDERALYNYVRRVEARRLLETQDFDPSSRPLLKLPSHSEDGASPASGNNDSTSPHESSALLLGCLALPSAAERSGEAGIASHMDMFLPEPEASSIPQIDFSGDVPGVRDWQIEVEAVDGQGLGGLEAEETDDVDSCDPTDAEPLLLLGDAAAGNRGIARVNMTGTPHKTRAQAIEHLRSSRKKADPGKASATAPVEAIQGAPCNQTVQAPPPTDVNRVQPEEPTASEHAHEPLCTDFNETECPAEGLSTGVVQWHRRVGPNGRVILSARVPGDGTPGKKDLPVLSLLPDRVYAVRTKLLDTDGREGTWSDDMFATTLPIPRVDVFSVSETSALLSWHRPRMSSPLIQMPNVTAHYGEDLAAQLLLLSYDPSDGTSACLVDDVFPALRTPLRIKGLKPNGRYSAIVRYRHSWTKAAPQHHGPWSPVARFGTLTGAWAKLTVVDLGQDYGRVTWTPPLLSVTQDTQEWVEHLPVCADPPLAVSVSLQGDVKRPYAVKHALCDMQLSLPQVQDSDRQYRGSSLLFSVQDTFVASPQPEAVKGYSIKAIPIILPNEAATPFPLTRAGSGSVQSPGRQGEAIKNAGKPAVPRYEEVSVNNKDDENTCDTGAVALQGTDTPQRVGSWEFTIQDLVPQTVYDIGLKYAASTLLCIHTPAPITDPCIPTEDRMVFGEVAPAAMPSAS